MFFLRNKTLYVSSDTGGYEPFATADKEIFLTADPIKGLFSYDEYVTAVCAPLSKRVVKVSLLYEDEVFHQDISEYVLECSIDLKYEQGLSRTTNLTLINNDGMWTPNPVNGRLWKGTKFNIEVGLYYNGTVFWCRGGIYIAGNPTINDKDKTVQIPCLDKFSLLDGNISGTIDNDFKLLPGTSVRLAVEQCLLAKQENDKIYDPKPPRFNTAKVNETTPYTISQSSGITYGEIIKELSNMIFCDVFYDEYGNLTISGNDDTNPLESRPVLWNFNDSVPLYEKPSITLNFTDVVNKVTVVGAIENGYRYKGVAINNNPKSRANIQFTSPKAEFIEDQNIIGDENCLGRAQYELKKKTLIGMQVKFSCAFIPTLVPGNLVTWTNKEHGYVNEKFFINSVSFDLGGQNLMSVSLTNINEVPI